MLITDEYRDLNTALHNSNPGYGTSGHRWAKQVSDLASQLGAPQKNVTVLDYGCGKGTLKAALPFPPAFYLFEYDPAVEGKENRPEPSDIVVCTDVLEHIEPDCLDDVLDDIRYLAKRVVFLTIATRPAQKTLADGRNAHLIVQPALWWLPKLLDRWSLRSIQDRGGELLFIGVPLS